MKVYDLDAIYNIMRNHNFELSNDIIDKIQTIGNSITPLFIEKKDFGRNRKKNTNQRQNDSNIDAWQDIKSKSNVIWKEKADTVEEWISEVRFALNKLSTSNYETLKTNICINIKKSINSENSSENLKKISNSIFTIASTNQFFSGIYAKIYKECMNMDNIFEEILLQYVQQYVQEVKESSYIDPDVDYEKYCNFTKENEKRKSLAIFIVNLMKEKSISVMRVLNLIVAFQTIVTEYVELEDKIHEVDEITDILYLFLKEGKEVYNKCKGEWIWKFVIKQNIENLATIGKFEKPSLSIRSIFKTKDMKNITD